MDQVVSRRGLLSAAGAAAAGVSLTPLAAPPARADSAGAGAPTRSDPGVLRVRKEDSRYETLSQGFNQRWTSSPDYIQLITNEADAVTAVKDALDAQLRPTVRSGGHCYEDFTANTGGAILDISGMRGVHRTTDSRGRTAYCVESGATNWDIYTTLFRRYGVTLPAGSCYSVGAGGHIAGGGYGLLSRRHGLTVDHLVQVDVVTVRGGKVEVARAHREDGGALGDLFWAHTGGGGGNFGVVLRYYFAADIPAPPADVWLSSVAWRWADLKDRPDDFGRLLRNYGEFLAAHSGDREQVYQGLFSLLRLTHKSNGNVVLTTQWDQEDPSPLNAFLNAVQAGLKTQATMQTSSAGGLFLPYTEKNRRMPWFQATMTLNGSGDNQRGKYKSAYHRRPFTTGQITGMWNWLTRDEPDLDLTQTLVQIDSYGCRVNAVAPGDTAVPQRDSVLKLQYQSYWTDPEKDGAHLDFMNGFYQEVYLETGGYPETSEVAPEQGTDGAYVNYPDTDLGRATDPDPLYPRLYYKGNYQRLQRAKSHWDPDNLFHHAQSIRLP